MRYLSLFLVIMLTGCITRHYHVHTDVPYRMSDDMSQQVSNETWGTSRLRVIKIRKIPQKTIEEAKCNEGFVQFCKQ